MTGIDKMRVELLLDRMRKDFREAVNTLIAAGVSERDAFIAAIDAMRALRVEVLKEWTDKNTRSAR